MRRIAIKDGEHMGSQFGSIIGGSKSMQAIYRQIERVTRYDIPVLVLGETGTGKDMIAREIHRTSQKPEELYYPVNMGAIPKDLIASTLFGHEKGSFTGATTMQKGIFETANGGTLFLDEIGTMDEEMQVSLLRVLEESKFRRVGGSAFHNCHVRLIAASNADLESAVREGMFREDLYYRLNVFMIHLPPLRERPDDILLLADTFRRRYSEEFGRDIRGFSDDAVRRLLSHDWPGNVRELENMVIRAIIAAEGDFITATDLFDEEMDDQEPDDGISRVQGGSTLEELEIELIQATLRKVNGRKGEAARMLGISRKGFYNKLKKYNLNFDEEKAENNATAYAGQTNDALRKVE